MNSRTWKAWCTPCQPVTSSSKNATTVVLGCSDRLRPSGPRPSPDRPSPDLPSPDRPSPGLPSLEPPSPDRPSPDPPSPDRASSAGVWIAPPATTTVLARTVSLGPGRPPGRTK
jgi:hypothetical protein